MNQQLWSIVLNVSTRQESKRRLLSPPWVVSRCEVEELKTWEQNLDEPQLCSLRASDKRTSYLVVLLCMLCI